MNEPRHRWGIADEVVEKFLLDVQRILKEDLMLPRSTYSRSGDLGWPTLLVLLPGTVEVIVQDGRHLGNPAGTVTVWDGRTLVEKRFSIAQDNLAIPDHAENEVAHYIAELEPREEDA